MGITARPKKADLEEIARYVRDINVDVDINVCEFLMVDKKYPKIYYCKLAGKEIDVAFNPCVLPAENRVVLCPYYRDYWFKAKAKSQ